MNACSAVHTWHTFLAACSRSCRSLPVEAASTWLLQRAPKHYSILTTPDPEEWRRVRKTISEAFSPAAIRKVRGRR